MSDPDTAEAIPTTRPLFGKPSAEAVEAITGAPVTEAATTLEAAPVDAAVTQEGIEANAAATLADAGAEVTDELAPTSEETEVESPLAEPASVGSTASAGDLTAATSNIDGTTNADLTDVEALEAQRDALDAQIKAQRDSEKNEVLTQVKTVMQSFGLTTEDYVNFMGDYKPKRTIAKAVPKYKDPASGITWSGRGKAPAWIKGQDYTKFLI